MSRANHCAHRLGVTFRHSLALACLLACSKPAHDTAFDDPAQASAHVRAMVDSCDGVTRALDQLAHARVHGRLLSGLVDDALASAKCADLASAVKGRAAAHQLARARLADGDPAKALSAVTDRREVAIRYRRAELLDRMGRPNEALAELDGIDLDDAAQAQWRLLRVSVTARARDVDGVRKVIGQAPIAERPRLAHRAVEDAPPELLVDLGRAEPVELAREAADKVEQSRGAMDALEARENVAKLDPGVAEHWDALARARMAAARTDEALDAWDRAIELAPAQPAFRIAPIRALMVAHDEKRAHWRADALAKHAHDKQDIELLITASAGASAAEDAKLAVELARQARALRSGDGRLAFVVAQRLAEAGEVKDAADAYAELLVCGAHGRAWHRHEVAGKLLEIARASDAARATVQAAVASKRACETVEPDDLATYTGPLLAR